MNYDGCNAEAIRVHKEFLIAEQIKANAVAYKKAKAKAKRAAIKEAYASCGMVKVKGGLGGVYWE